MPTYTSYYPGGWKNLPDESTPIIAAALQNMEAGIAAANAAAGAGSVAGSGGYVVVPGLALNGASATPTDDAIAIQAALDKVADGLTPGHVFVTGPAGSVGYLNSTITVSKPGAILEFDRAVQWLGGPSLRIRLWGTIPETPTTNATKPALTQDEPQGATVLHVTQIPADWQPGIYVGLRGRRDASGSVPNSEIFRTYVTAIDRTAKTLTLRQPLPKAFAQVNDTTWSNKASQVTKITQAKLAGTPEAGDTVLECEDTSIFAVNSVVQIQDSLHTIDGDNAIRTGNFVHKEVNRVAEIIDATHLKLAAPLEHDYSISDDGRVVLLNALQDSQIIGLRLKWAAQQAEGQHAIEIRYAVATHAIDCHIEGSGEGGVSWSGHAVRITDSLACSGQRCLAVNPSLVTPGRGYAFTFYGSTGCWYQDCYASGCRHSFLWFNGTCGSGVYNCQSTDARISDYDWHGAEENHNWTLGCVARGGTRRTEDSSQRVAWKFGNPSQTNGSRANQALDCLVIKYHGAAVELLPRSRDDVWQGVVRGATVGIRMITIPDNKMFAQSGFTVRDSEFWDVRAPLDVDGGPNSIITGFTLENTRFERCGPLQLINAPGSKIKNVTVHAPTGTGHQIMAWGCDGIAITGCDLSSAPKGIAITSSPGARVTGNRLHDLGGSEFHDGGGNTGMLFRSNEIFPSTGTLTRTGSASSGTVQSMTDGGTLAIGAATTGTTWADPEDALGSDGTTPPGSTGGSGTPGGGTPPGNGNEGGFPIMGRSGLPWNSGFFHGGGNAGDATGAPAAYLRTRPMDAYETFQGRSNWDEMFYIDPSWAGFPGVLVIAVPFQPATDNNSGTAAGNNNTRWRNFGSALTAAGLNRQRTVIRLAWEQNGNWYPWAWGGTQNTPASYVSAFKQVVNSLRQTAPNLSFSTNYNRNNKDGRGTDWRTVTRQLKGYADIVGLDSYDMYNAAPNASTWAAQIGQDPGPTSVASFCRDEGFLMAVEEWAPVVAGGADGTGGGDNPYYINRMWDWFVANQDILAYEIFYDHVGTSDYNHLMTGPSSDPASYKPNAWAAYKSHWNL